MLINKLMLSFYFLFIFFVLFCAATITTANIFPASTAGHIFFFFKAVIPKLFSYLLCFDLGSDLQSHCTLQEKTSESLCEQQLNLSLLVPGLVKLKSGDWKGEPSQTTLFLQHNLKAGSNRSLHSKSRS